MKVGINWKKPRIFFDCLFDPINNHILLPRWALCQALPEWENTSDNKANWIQSWFFLSVLGRQSRWVIEFDPWLFLGHVWHIFILTFFFLSSFCSTSIKWLLSKKALKPHEVWQIDPTDQILTLKEWKPKKPGDKKPKTEYWIKKDEGKHSTLVIELDNLPLIEARNKPKKNKAKYEPKKILRAQQGKFFSDFDQIQHDLCSFRKGRTHHDKTRQTSYVLYQSFMIFLTCFFSSKKDYTSTTFRSTTKEKFKT